MGRKEINIRSRRSGKITESVRFGLSRRSRGDDNFANHSCLSKTLVDEHQQFAESLVNRLMVEFNLGVNERDDLLGAAYLGLVEAAQRFNPNQCTSFKVFSFLRIRGAIIDHLRANALIHRGLNQRIKAFVAASNLREVTSIEHKGLSLIEKQRVVFGLIGDYALIMRLSMESDEILGTYDPKIGPDDATDQRIKGKILRNLIEKLPANQKLIIKKYYLEDLSFSEIVALEPGFTKSWVSRLHRRGLETLRGLILATKDAMGEEYVSKKIDLNSKLTSKPATKHRNHSKPGASRLITEYKQALSNEVTINTQGSDKLDPESPGMLKAKAIPKVESCIQSHQVNEKPRPIRGKSPRRAPIYRARARSPNLVD